MKRGQGEDRGVGARRATPGDRETGETQRRRRTGHRGSCSEPETGGLLGGTLRRWCPVSGGRDPPSVPTEHGRRNFISNQDGTNKQTNKT